MRCLCCLSVAGLLLAAPLLAAPPNDFTRARPAIERKLRAPLHTTRIEGLEELARFPQPEAAQLALTLAKDPEFRVRNAALRTLGQLHDDAQVRAWMLKRAVPDVNETTATLLAVLFANADAKDLPALTEPLNKAFKAQPVRLVFLLPVIEELGNWTDAASVRALTRMTKLEAFPKTLGMQRCVVRSLLGIRLNDAVTALIELLPQLDGEVLFQVGDHLNKITGEPYGTNVEAWQLWWPQNQEAFRYPLPGSLPPPRVARPDEDGPRYYGLAIRARKVFFIIDVSGSMAGIKLYNAKKEVIQAIGKLPPKCEFNIMVFSSRVNVWSQKMVDASDDNKKRATTFAGGLTARGPTHTYDALKAALDMRPESIYILTDGEPTGGAVVAPEAINLAIRGQNRLQGTSIHSIGIGTGPDTTLFSRFLLGLSEQNYGQFRRID